MVVQEYRPVVHRLRRIRPRLSSRLTLGGLALPRNPWVYGGGVSRSALVTHASILTSMRSTRACRLALRRTWKAPLPLVSKLQARRFGDELEPRELSAHVHSTSELLRTL